MISNLLKLGAVLSLFVSVALSASSTASPKTVSGAAIQSKTLTHFDTKELSGAQLWQDGLFWSASTYDYDASTGHSFANPKISVFDPAHPEQGALASTPAQIFIQMSHLRLVGLGHHRVLALGQTADRIGFYAILEYTPGKKTIRIWTRALSFGSMPGAYAVDSSGNQYLLDHLNDGIVALGNGPLELTGITMKEAREESDGIVNETQSDRDNTGVDVPSPKFEAFQQRKAKLYLPVYLGHVPPEEGWSPVSDLIFQDEGFYNLETGPQVPNGEAYRIDLKTHEKITFFKHDRGMLSHLIPLSNHRLALFEGYRRALHILNTLSHRVEASVTVGKKSGVFYDMQKYGAHCLAILDRTARQLLFVDTSAAGYPVIAQWDLSGSYAKKETPSAIDTDPHTGTVFVRASTVYLGDDGKLPGGSPNQVKMFSEKAGTTFNQCK